MNVAEKKRCDAKCHKRSGCAVRGEGKCDSYCITGYGVDPDDYTCMSECDSVILILVVTIMRVMIISHLRVKDTAVN